VPYVPEVQMRLGVGPSVLGLVMLGLLLIVAGAGSVRVRT